MRHQPAIGRGGAAHSRLLRHRIERRRHRLVAARHRVGDAPARQRRPGQRGQPMLHRDGEQPILDGVDDQRRDFRLDGGQRHSRALHQPHERAGLRGMEIGDAEGADLARAVRRLGKAHQLGGMRQHIGPVDLVEVDMIDPQPRQRRVERGGQIVEARIIGQRRQDPALGRQHDAAADRRVGAQHLAQQALGVPEPARPVEAVDVGGIEQGDTGIQHRPYERVRRARVAGETPHAPGEARHRDAAGPQRAGGGGRGQQAHDAISLTGGATDPRSISACGRRRWVMVVPPASSSSAAA